MALLTLLRRHASHPFADDGVTDGASCVDAGGLPVVRAEAALRALQSLRHASLAIRVLIGDERRYVAHTHVEPFWGRRGLHPGGARRAR